MNIKDKNNLYMGRISTVLVSRDTGKVIGHGPANHNVISYNGADILAQLLVGNRNYAPSAIGFIYAPSGEVMVDPGVDRDQSWDVISADVEGVTGNMVISPLGSNPLIASDGPEGRYDGNAVTFTAVSDKLADLVFSGGAYAVAGPTSGADKYFQVVLLAEVYAPGSTVPTYVPYARAALGSGIDVAADTELAVFWTQVFK